MSLACLASGLRPKRQPETLVDVNNNIIMFDTNTRWGDSVPYPRAPRQESVTPFQLRQTQFPALKWIKGQKQLGIQSGSSPILCHPSCALQFTGHRTSPCNFTKFLLAIDPSGLPKQSVHSGLPPRGLSSVLCRSPPDLASLPCGPLGTHQSPEEYLSMVGFSCFNWA